jgi:uncharacterized protein YecT (DUF1311 family)
MVLRKLQPFVNKKFQLCISKIEFKIFEALKKSQIAWVENSVIKEIKLCCISVN